MIKNISCVTITHTGYKLQWISFLLLLYAYQRIKTTTSTASLFLSLSLCLHPVMVITYKHLIVVLHIFPSTQIPLIKPAINSKTSQHYHWITPTHTHNYVIKILAMECVI